MGEIILYFIIVITLWTFIAIASRGSKSDELKIAVKGITISINQISRQIKCLLTLLIKDLLEERFQVIKRNKPLSPIGGEVDGSIINERNYPYLIDEIYRQTQSGIK